MSVNVNMHAYRGDKRGSDAYNIVSRLDGTDRYVFKVVSDSGSAAFTLFCELDHLREMHDLLGDFLFNEENGVVWSADMAEAN